jgi:hypothetical protein
LLSVGLTAQLPLLLEGAAAGGGRASGNSGLPTASDVIFFASTQAARPIHQVPVVVYLEPVAIGEAEPATLSSERLTRLEVEHHNAAIVIDTDANSAARDDMDGGLATLEPTAGCSTASTTRRRAASR